MPLSGHDPPLGGGGAKYEEEGGRAGALAAPHLLPPSNWRGGSSRDDDPGAPEHCKPVAGYDLVLGGGVAEDEERAGVPSVPHLLPPSSRR